MSKIKVHCYSTDEHINQFSIGYMINSLLKCDKVFRLKVGTFLSFSFAYNTMNIIRHCLKKKNMCVMARIMIYENNRGNVKKYTEC